MCTGTAAAHSRQDIRELTHSPHRFFSLAHFATPPLLHACGAGFSDELPCDASSLGSAGLRSQA